MPDFSHIKVKLKPLLGIAPGIYLSALYGLIFVCAVFFIFLFPGLKAYGTYITFSSSPHEASVWIDSEYQGATPCEVFVPAGIHTIEIRKAFYESKQIQYRAKGRLFGTIIFPLRREVRTQIVVKDIKALTEWTLRDFAAWGMLSEFSKGYGLEGGLSDAARSTWTVSKDKLPIIKASLYDLLDNSSSPTAA